MSAPVLMRVRKELSGANGVLTNDGTVLISDVFSSSPLATNGTPKRSPIPAIPFLMREPNEAPPSKAPSTRPPALRGC